MLPISGRLSERYGHRRMFLGSVIAFTVASLCCELVDDIFALIALRALQATGGGGFTPSATGIIVDHFGDERAARKPVVREGAASASSTIACASSTTRSRCCSPRKLSA